jgi:DNA-binding NtrC family response regulator
MARKKRILLFEDFDSIRNILVKTIEKKDVELIIVKSLSEALQELNGISISLLITDVDNKNDSASMLIKRMRETSSYLYTPVMLLISGNKELYSEKFAQYNIASYLSKPFDMVLFNSVVDRFC